MELHFQHEALPRFIENVLRSTLSYPNETSKECIQFLGKPHDRRKKPHRRSTSFDKFDHISLFRVQLTTG